MNGDYWGINETALLGLPVLILCIGLPLLTIGPVWNTIGLLFGRGRYFDEQDQPFERKSSWRICAVLALLIVIVLGILGFVLPPS